MDESLQLDLHPPNLLGNQSEGKSILDGKITSIVQSLTFTAWSIVLFCAITFGTIVYFSGDPVLYLLASGVACIPPFFVLGFILLQITDDSLSRSFIVEQLFVGGIIGYSIAFIAEILLGFAASMVLFKDQLPIVLEEYSSEKLFNIAQTVPEWKLILAPVVAAFIIAAGIEEFVKYNVGRRARSVGMLSPQNFVGGVMLGALGLATTEHFIISVRAIAAEGWENIVPAMELSLFRALTAFPLHVGNGLLIGIAMAQRSNVFVALAIAVLFHGSFDFALMIVQVLLFLEKVPEYTQYGALAFNILLVCGLMWLCKRRYNRFQKAISYSPLDTDVI